MRERLLTLVFMVISGLSHDKANIGEFNSNDVLSMDSNSINHFYYSLKSDDNKPEIDVFFYGIIGYFEMINQGEIENKRFITIIDYSLSSTEKRLWVIDIFSKEIVQSTYVAHGMNSGLEYAKKFSNTPDSNMSSIGFFLTDSTYIGKHGLSLILDGLEEGINNNARERNVVMHAAHYVSDNFIDKYGRLGRSFGCPALPFELNAEIINLIKDKSLLFIYYPDPLYLSNSKILKDKRELFLSWARIAQFG